MLWINIDAYHWITIQGIVAWFRIIVGRIDDNVETGQNPHFKAENIHLMFLKRVTLRANGFWDVYGRFQDRMWGAVGSALMTVRVDVKWTSGHSTLN